MDATKPLTAEDIRSGVQAAIECRRIMARHGAQLASFMAGLGLLLVGAAYFTQGYVSPWTLVLPAALATIVLPSIIRHVWRLSRLLREFEVAERTVAAGGVVRAQDIPSLGCGQRSN